MNIIEKIFNVIQNRRKHPKEGSYVSKMHEKGLNAVLKKIGEEAGEVVIASKGGAREEIIHEIADLWFHTLLVLEFHGLSPEDIYKELEGRHKGD